MKQKSNGNKRSALPHKGSGMAIGATLGFIFGLMLFDNLALGLVLGVAIGLGIGSMVDIQANKARK
jgi:flagellar biosynthesis protein FliR